MQTIYAKLTQRERGFTLIELLVVIAIIAVLAALILAALTSAQKGARDSKRKSDLNQYKTALAQFNADTSAYPQSTGSAINDIAGGAPPCNAANWTSYMSNCLVGAQAARPYKYISSGTNQFAVCADLEKINGNRFRVTPTVSIEEGGAASGCTQSD